MADGSSLPALLFRDGVDRLAAHRSFLRTKIMTLSRSIALGVLASVLVFSANAQSAEQPYRYRAVLSCVKPSGNLLLLTRLSDCFSGSGGTLGNHRAPTLKVTRGNEERTYLHHEIDALGGDLYENSYTIDGVWLQLPEHFRITATNSSNFLLTIRIFEANSKTPIHQEQAETFRTIDVAR